MEKKSQKAAGKTRQTRQTMDMKRAGRHKDRRRRARPPPRRPPRGGAGGARRPAAPRQPHATAPRRRRRRCNQRRGIFTTSRRTRLVTFNSGSEAADAHGGNNEFPITMLKAQSAQGSMTAWTGPWRPLLGRVPPRPDVQNQVEHRLGRRDRPMNSKPHNINAPRNIIHI